jgi:hypothetical protein
VSEQNPIGIQASIELVNSLHATAADFVAREKALTRSISLGTYTFEKQRDEALENENTWLEAEDERLDGELAAANDLARAKFDQRQQWIERAWRNSKQRFLQSLAESEGQRKYSIQKTMLETEKHRKAALSRADSDYGEFQQALAEDRRIFRSLAALALKSLRGYPVFMKALARGLKSVANDPTHDDKSAFECREELHEQLKLVDENLLAFRKHFLPRFFSILPLSLLCVLIALLHLAAIPLLGYFGLEASWPTIAGSALAFMAGAGAVHLIGGLGWRSAATTLTEDLRKSRQLLDRCEQASGSSYQQRRDQIAKSHEDTTAKLDSEWNQVLETSAETREAKPEAVLDGKRQRSIETAKALHQSRLQQIESSHSAEVQRQKQESDARIAKIISDCDTGIQRAQAEHQQQHEALTKEWGETVEPIYSIISASENWAAENFPEWSSGHWKDWKPPQTFRNFAKFGELEIDLPKLCGELPKDKLLALPGPAQFSLPLMLDLPSHGSLLLETSDRGQKEGVAALNHLILALLTGAPPGMASFSIIDPVGLGENFSSIMHLADYENNLINDRIWTQTEQIDKRLEELNEHMEKVIQMYLRNEYETIAEYNLQAGNIAEKYHFLVIADFPTNFSDSAAKRLLSIAASGARCGVYTLIHWDTRRSIPQDFVASELRRSSACITCGKDGFALSHYSPPGASLYLDSPPPPEIATELIQKIGAGSKDANRIEVPFSHVTPPDDQLWQGDTTSELRVAIGRTGATKLQYLAIGKGTRQHTLIAGKTGSGKSTLFHVIITNLALSCSPDQVEFYLIDFKKGIEFKCYATHRLPHARVIAIESDREFGLSVLQRVDEELKRRGDLFRKLGVQDLAGYKKAGGTEVVPRSLLMIDEFQELFVEDDRISQNASMLLDRIVRQGRAFGIHVILGSQTLGGAYTLPRTTLGQMVIRIALQCNEADAYLIMDDNNPAPRLLSRPGEGIYNDSAGAVEGNSPFQTVWISDEERDAALEKVAQLAEKQAPLFPAAIVFEGNAPADIRENAKLGKLLDSSPPLTPPLSSRTWLGAPNSIKGPTEAVFHRQSGNHLLIVGQNEEASQAIVSTSLLALAAQQAPDDSHFFLLDSSPPDSSGHKLFESLARDLPYQIAAGGGVAAVDMVAKVSQEMDRRSDDAAGGTDSGSVFLIINGLQRFKKLRFEEDFGFSMDDDASPANPGAQLDRIIQEGASLGIHLLVVCDTFNNVNRFLSRKALSEFEMRVLFQMSANDSASLIDTPKASQLGLNRALFYNEQEGYLETFRPYAPPDTEWFTQAIRQLSSHQVAANP